MKKVSSYEMLSELIAKINKTGIAVISPVGVHNFSVSWDSRI